MAMVVHGYFEFEYWRQRSKVAPGDEFFYTQPSGSERKVRAVRKCTYYTQPSRLREKCSKERRRMSGALLYSAIHNSAHTHTNTHKNHRCKEGSKKE